MVGSVRPFLAVVALLAAASVSVGSRPAGAEAAQPPEGTVTDLGPASVTSAFGNGEFVGDTLYAVTRGLSPNVVGAYDLAADKVTSHIDIPTGIGAWATTTVGTDLYVGTHIPSDLYRVDTLTGTATKVASFPDHFIWNIDAAPDGKVYIGFSESGRVVEYDPATGDTRDLGVASAGEQYVRSIAADDSTVYAGVGSHAHLVAIDRASGAKREILPPELATRDFVASMDLDDSHIAMGISSAAELLVMDKSDPTKYHIAKATAPGEKYVTSVALDGDHVYFAGRPTGTVYRYTMSTDTVEVLGVPYPEAGTQRILVHGDEVYGLQDFGAAFVYHKSTGEMEYRNLVERGFRAAPEQPMTLLADGERVYVSGKGGAQIHHLASGEQSRLVMPGEPKSWVTVGDRMYTGVYTQALLYGYSPGDTEAELLARTGNQQDRPRDMAYDRRRGQLVIGTQPEPGHPNGAVSLYDVADKKLDVHRGVIDRQSIYSVAVGEDMAYLGSYIQEGFGLPPVHDTATLAAFDLDTRTVRWQLDPVPGAQFIADLATFGGRLYGVTDNGVLFEVDPVRRKVLRTAKVADAGGDLLVKGAVLYGTDGDRVYKVEPSSLRVSTVVDGLAGDWFDGAKLAADPEANALYALRGRNLVRIDVSGRP